MAKNFLLKLPSFSISNQFFQIINKREYESGKLLSETQFNHRLNAYRKATGAIFTPHQLRHEYATVLYEAGVDEGAAQKIMGHSDIRTTQNIYTHIRQNKLASAADLLEQLIVSDNK